MKFRGIVLATAVALCFLLAPGRAQAAQSMFLEISGVPGEATTPAAFVNQIAVLAVSCSRKDKSAREKDSFAPKKAGCGRLCSPFFAVVMATFTGWPEVVTCTMGS